MNSRYSFSSIYSFSSMKKQFMLGQILCWFQWIFFPLLIHTFIHLLIHQQIFYFPFYFVINTLLGRMDTMVSQHTRAYWFYGFSVYWEEILQWNNFISKHTIRKRDVLMHKSMVMRKSRKGLHELKPEE